MLKKALNEFNGGDGAVLDRLGAVVAVTESDLPIFQTFQAVIGQSDAENVAAQVLEHFFSRPGMLTMHHPGFVPNLRSNSVEKVGFFQSGAHLGAEDYGERVDWDEKLRVFRLDPASVIGTKASGGDQHMNVRMVEHGARPGVEDREHTHTRAEEAGIVGEFL